MTVMVGSLSTRSGGHVTGFRFGLNDLPFAHRMISIQRHPVHPDAHLGAWRNVDSWRRFDAGYAAGSPAQVRQVHLSLRQRRGPPEPLCGHPGRGAVATIIHSQGLGAILRRILAYARKTLKWEERLDAVRDARRRPQIAARVIVRAVAVMFLSRRGSLNALEQTQAGREPISGVQAGACGIHHPLWGKKWARGSRFDDFCETKSVMESKPG